MNSDNTLVRQAKAGNYHAFEQLVNRHEGRLYSLAIKILRQREDAEDVVQSAFISALEQLDGFQEKALFATWITRIATNKALNVLRKRKGLKKISLNEVTEKNEDGIIPHPEYIATWNDNPEKIFEQKELAGILDAAINSLPEKYRLVFVLRDLEEMSIEETANILQLSTANIKVRLLRARLALREELTRVFGDESKRIFSEHHHGESENNSTPAELLLKNYENLNRML